MNATQPITITEATRYLPQRNGKKVHRQTVIRWIRKGCRGVRLHGWKEGETWFTTPASIDEFRRELTRKSCGACPQRTQTQASDAVRRARERLREKGFYGRETSKVPRMQQSTRVAHSRSLPELSAAGTAAGQSGSGD